MTDSHPFIKKIEARDRVSEQEREVLAKLISRTKEFQADEPVVRDGDRPRHSSVLLEGFACRSKTLKDGRRQITEFHVPGDFVDLHSFPLKQLDHDVIALTRCQIGIVPHERLSDITETMPHLTRLLWLMTLIDAAVHREWIVGMGRRTATARIAHLFCELCARLDPVGLVKGHSYHLPVSQQQLSDALGLSLVHTNRMLASLRKNGLLTFADQTVTIRDWAGLMHLAQFDPSYLCLRLEPR